MSAVAPFLYADDQGVGGPCEQLVEVGVEGGVEGDLAIAELAFGVAAAGAGAQGLDLSAGDRALPGRRRVGGWRVHEGHHAVPVPKAAHPAPENGAVLCCAEEIYAEGHAASLSS